MKDLRQAVSNAGKVEAVSNAGTVEAVSNAGTIEAVSNAGTVMVVSNAGTIEAVSNVNRYSTSSIQCGEKKTQKESLWTKPQNKNSVDPLQLIAILPISLQPLPL